MIKEDLINKIDVCQTYFGIDDVPVFKYSCLFDTDNMIYMNEVIPRNMAVSLVKQICSTGMNPTACLYISTNVIAASYIKDFTGNKIFQLPNEKICGWFVQHDPTPFANWYHKCWYYFIVNEYYIHTIESKYGICDTIEMELT